MNRAGELAAVVLLVCGVHAGCGGGSNGGREDPYANLMDVAEGEVKCVADECCFGSCGGSGDTVCVTRSADLIVQSLDADGAVPDCPELIFPEWFYNHDCFVGTGGIVGPGHPSKAGEPLTFPNVYHSSGQSYLLYVQCFCGRGSSGFSSAYSSTMIMYDNGCGQPLTVADEDEVRRLLSCDNPCVTCEPSCDGRQCGSDGCGGSCGTCSSGQICSSAGRCVSEGSGDTCSACLATCSGLTSCCTGCGCLCEYECGQCF